MLRFLILFSFPLLAQFGVKYWKPVGVGNTAARPAGCTMNKDTYINTQTTTIDYCTAANTWTSLTAAGGSVTTGVTLTADLPVIGAGGSAVAVGTRSGNTTAFVTKDASSPATNDCAKWDANGNLTTAGAACGTSTGLGDPGSNGIVYRNGSGTSTVASATEMAGPLYCADAGANDTYTCTLSPAPSAYTTGATYIFKANTANTGAATVNFNSLGAKTIKKVAGGITTDLADNDIRSGQFVELVYDGTNMQMQSTLGNAAAGGSGNSTTTGAYASNPGTCTDGDVRFPSDSLYLLRCASNVWVPWGLFYPMSDPALASLSTWRNQGSATVDSTYGGIFLSAPAGAGDNLRIREKNVPAAPYTITATFALDIMFVDYAYCGIALIESGTGEVVTFGITQASSLSSTHHSWRLAKWTNVTTFSADYFSHAVLPGGFLGRAGVTLKINDDNTNRISSICIDPQGLKCRQVHTVGRTDHLTPDKVGIFCNSSNATWDASMWLSSWREQ